MAEGDTRKKQLKIDVPHPDTRTKTLISDSILALESNIYNSLVLLKIIYCDAKEPSPFTQAICVVKRSTEVENEKQFTVYAFASTFQRGVGIVNNFLKNPTDLPDSEGAAIALLRLMKFLEESDSVAVKLSKSLNEGTRREAAWSIQLVHHLLKELAVNQNYIIDSGCKFKEYCCKCCGERITGQYADTSIGHEKVWHGNIDILIGHECATLTVDDDDEDDDCTENKHVSPFETKDETSEIQNHEQQIISEAIVFAFLQRKVHLNEFDYFLIPTIALSRKHVLFCFYDPTHDILLQSTKAMPLFSGDSEFRYITVLALWLAINYLYFSSGITEDMLERNFKACFLQSLNKTHQELYKKSLRFGNCKTKRRKRDGDALLPDLSLAYGKPIASNALEEKEKKKMSP